MQEPGRPCCFCLLTTAGRYFSDILSLQIWEDVCHTVTRLAAIDGDDGYTGVKPQHRYVTCPPWHHPSPSFRFFL